MSDEQSAFPEKDTVLKKPDIKAVKNKIDQAKCQALKRTLSYQDPKYQVLEKLFKRQKVENDEATGSQTPAH
jgi:hypothetical protein